MNMSVYTFGLQVINDMLPKQSKKQMDMLIAECQDAQYKLEVIPTTTLEFVESLTFLDEIQLRVGHTNVLSLDFHVYKLYPSKCYLFQFDSVNCLDVVSTFYDGWP